MKRPLATALAGAALADQRMNLPSRSGWLEFHQGDVFMMPTGVRDFRFVFKGGETADNCAELAFDHWSRS